MAPNAKRGGATRQRLRCWVFTIQSNIRESVTGPDTGPPASDESQWDPWALSFDTEVVRYLCCGAEVCPTSRRYHWQGYVEFTKALDLSSTKKALQCSYAHLEPRRGSQQQAIDYCKKSESGVLDDDGNKLYFEVGEPARDGVRSGSSKNKNYATVLEMPTYQESVEKLRELEPADYVRFHTSVINALRAHHLKPKVFIRPAESFNVPLISDDVLSKLAVVITGISAAGKTAFAKAHFKNPMVVSHIDDLKRFQPLEHDGLVFDDMSFSHWPVGSCIHLLDMEDDRSINCRHLCGYIPAWTRRIFTSNKALHDVFNVKDANEQEECAIFRRFFHMHVTKKLFD